MAWKDSGNGIWHLQFGSLRARLENGYAPLPGHWVLSCPGLMRPSSVGPVNENVERVKLTAITKLMELLTEASEDLGKSI